MNKVKLRRACALFSLLIVMAVVFASCGDLPFGGEPIMEDEPTKKIGTTVFYVPAGNYSPTASEIEDLKASLRARLDGLGYSKARVASFNTEAGVRFVVEIPGESVKRDVVDKIGATGEFTFRDYTGEVLLSGSDVASASAEYGDTGTGKANWFVSITLKEDSVAKFADATAKVSAYASGNNYLSIYLDEAEVTSPTVSQPLAQKDIMLTGQFDRATAEYYAGVINAGALPFALEVEKITVNN